MLKHRYAICACARWETPYIVEWLDYYRALGFDHVYLYCNDDDPGPFYAAVLPFTQGPAPFVTFRYHPHQGEQYEMYVHFVDHFLAETEWVSFLDIDEFLRLPPGVDVAGFMGRFLPMVECVMFNWVFFGPNGHKTPPAGPVLESFTRREAWLHPYTKYIARSSAVAEIDFTARGRAHGFWHEIGTKLGRATVSANALGEQMMGYYEGFPERSAAFVNEPERREKLLQTAVIHHYGFRSEQAYAARSARGLKGDFSGQDVWRQLAEGPRFAAELAKVNEVEDVSLAGFWQGVRGRGAALGTGLEAQAVGVRAPGEVSPGQLAARVGEGWKHRYAICACARWETQYIVEWLDYYRALGFDHVYLYCNDDDPGPFYAAVLPFTQGPAPFVTFRHHPHQGEQYEMYVHFVDHFLAETEWVSFLDIDEFLRLPPGVDVAGFMGRFLPMVECVMFNWVFFGPNGHKTPPAGPVLENFTRRRALVDPNTKYIARSSAVAEIDFTARGRAQIFWHDIASKIDRMIVTANVLGEHMMGYYEGFPERAEAFVNEPERRKKLLQTAAVHHYGFRSEQAYAARSARGLKGDFSGQDAWRQLAEGPRFAAELAMINEVEDVSLAGFWEELRQRGRGLGTGLAEQALSARAAGTVSPGAKYRFVLIACARWEAGCIAEWIAYHRHIGFEHLYLYCNDDTPEELYEAVLPFCQGDAPFVTFHHFQPLGQQKAMYLHYLRHYKDEAEWMMFLDIDEFLRLPRHGSIGDFIAEHGAADAIYFNWCFFGNNGFDERPPGSVLLNYNRRAASSYNVMTKMITRSAAIKLDRLGLGPATDFWHYWNGLEDFASLKAVNVLGRDMHGYLDDLDASRAYLDEPGVYEAMIATGIVNHYAYKSRQDFLRRTARGTAGVFEDQAVYKELYESDRMDRVLARLNAVEDNVLRDLWASVLARGRAGAIASASELPGRANGPMTWGDAAAPDGPVYFVQDTQPEKIAAVLAAGHKTIVVEPDAMVYYELTERFAGDVAEGRLVVENYLPAEQSDGIVLFTPPGGGAGFHVGTIGWPQLLARHGAPAAMYLGRPVPGFPAPADLP